jgi:hypothetical protein
LMSRSSLEQVLKLVLVLVLVLKSSVRRTN